MEKAKSDHKEDEAAIREYVKQFPEAWNRGDVKAMTAPFHPDAIIRGKGACLVAGPKMLGDYWTDVLPTLYRSSTFTATVSSIRFIRPDVAIVEGTTSLQGCRNLEGQVAPPINTLYTIVATKENGKWGAAAVHAMVPVTPWFGALPTSGTQAR